MKTIKTITIAGMLLLLGNLSAKEPRKERVPVKNLSEQIAHYLRGTSISVRDQELKAKIVFTINDDMEIVILAVHSAHPELAYLIKRQLNNKRMYVTKYVAGRNYIVPVRVVV